jgi:hypothetical protein
MPFLDALSGIRDFEDVVSVQERKMEERGRFGGGCYGGKFGKEGV